MEERAGAGRQTGRQTGRSTHYAHLATSCLVLSDASAAAAGVVVVIMLSECDEKLDDAR